MKPNVVYDMAASLISQWIRVITNVVYDMTASLISQWIKVITKL